MKILEFWLTCNERAVYEVDGSEIEIDSGAGLDEYLENNSKLTPYVDAEIIQVYHDGESLRVKAVV